MAASLPTRRLGALEVPAIGFGAMVLASNVYDEVDEDTAQRALAAAVEAGSTFVDTSDSYFGNEETIGRFLQGRRRDEIQIGTKFGLRIPDGEVAHQVPVPWTMGSFPINDEPRLVRRYLEDSLRRLGTDHVDLYYPHFIDPEVPVADTVGAMADLVHEGLVRHVGLSNPTAEHLRLAQDVHPIAAVQVEWSMWHPIEPALLDRCEATGTGIVAWSPMGRGFLTGELTDVGRRDFRQFVDRLAGDNLKTNNERFQPVRAIADGLGISSGELALAWLLHQTSLVVPIPGSRTPAHIAQNAGAARLRLDADVLARVDLAMSAFEPVGDVT